MSTPAPGPMTLRVLKWDVPVDDAEYLVGNGPVALVACQHSPDVVQVWTIETVTLAGSPADRIRRRVRVFGTGHNVPYLWEHLGSVVTAQGHLVWHLFAHPLPADSEDDQS